MAMKSGIWQNRTTHLMVREKKNKMGLKSNSSFKGLPLMTYRLPVRLHLAKTPPPPNSTDLHIKQWPFGKDTIKDLHTSVTSKEKSVKREKNNFKHELKKANGQEVTTSGIPSVGKAIRESQ